MRTVKTSTWSTGYGMDVFIKNNCATTTLAWNVQFDLPAGTTVSSHWSATKTQSGQHFTFVNVGFNGDIAPGQEEDFGFNASGTGNPVNLTVR